MFSPSCVPVFDLHSNHQEGQHWFRGWFQDKESAYANSQHATGSALSPPLPSTSPPSLAVYSFDQWSALLNTNCSSNIYAGYCLDVTTSDLSFGCGAQDLELSPCNSSTPPSSMASPLDDDSPLYFTSPNLLSRSSSSPFKVSDVGGQDLAAPVLPYQDHAWSQPTDIPYSISPGQHLALPISLPERITADVLSIANKSPHGTVANNLCALPDNFIAPPTPMETTALGLYYSDTTQSPDAPLDSTQAENNASIPCVFQRVPPPAENWTFLAVDPAPRSTPAKRPQSAKARPSDAVTAATTTTSPSAKVEPLVECKQCGYLQLTRRMGDFRRHLKKHEAEHLSRVVCCGVPSTHPAVARFRPGHLTHWYDGHPFYGGCGRSYSRMDALQRHLKKSGCIGGTARDHQSWRKLYFPDRTPRPHKAAESSAPSSESQKLPVSSPTLPASSRL